MAQPPGHARATDRPGAHSRAYMLRSYSATAVPGGAAAAVAAAGGPVVRSPSCCCCCCACCLACCCRSCAACRASWSAADTAHSRAAASWPCHTISVGHTKPSDTCGWQGGTSVYAIMQGSGLSSWDIRTSPGAQIHHPGSFCCFLLTCDPPPPTRPPRCTWRTGTHLGRPPPKAPASPGTARMPPAGRSQETASSYSFFKSWT